MEASEISDSNPEEKLKGLNTEAKNITAILKEFKIENTRQFFDDEECLLFLRYVENKCKRCEQRQLLVNHIVLRENINRYNSYQNRIELFAVTKGTELGRRTTEILGDCVFDICRCVRRTTGYWPRSTQILSVYLLIKFIAKGILLQIQTGEGKSCIVAMFSVFLFLSKNNKVDVISSSPILATRDAAQWREFYELFEITVGCNLVPSTNNERKTCYTNDIVYGTVSSFASDILRHEFLMEDIFENQGPRATVVDEVDCMLLDQSIHSTYLSQSLPGLHHIEPIILMIWNEVISHPVVMSNSSQMFYVGKPEPFHVLLSNITNSCIETTIKPISIIQLLEQNKYLEEEFTVKMIKDTEAANIESNCFKETFSKKKIKDCIEFFQGKLHMLFELYVISDTEIECISHASRITKPCVKILLVGEGLVCLLYENMKTISEKIKEKIWGLVSSSNEDSYEVPYYLHEFINNRMISWIENAFIAGEMREKREYIVTGDGVLPVDFDSTGVVQANTKWGDCLHQFLELKHGKQMSQITIETNFLSNHSFFKRYIGRIYGVSGTLGTSTEKKFMTDNYNLSCLSVPTFRPKQLDEIPGIVCESKEEWVSNIVSIVTKNIENKRSVLVINEDIMTSEIMSEKLQANCPSASIHLYTKNDKEDQLREKPLKGMEIIVATNIAGRGTDLEVCESLSDRGGLFVLVTFLPLNNRVERQVFGRTARKGQSGNAQMVINKLDLDSDFRSFKTIQLVKAERDDREAKRVKGQIHKELEKVKRKEILFQTYCNFLKDHIIRNENLSQYDKDVTISSLHEFWGMWLKMKSEKLEMDNFQRISKSILHELEIKLLEARDEMLKKTSPSSNIAHIVKFANIQFFNKCYTEAKDLYSKAIYLDKKWAAIALYNRAYCHLLLKKKSYIDLALKDFRSALDGFNIFKEELLLCSTLLSNTPSTKKDSVTDRQFKVRCHIINYLEENIGEAIKTLETLKKDQKDAEVVRSNIFCVNLASDTTAKDYDEGVYMFWELGLTEIVTIEEKKPFCWKGVMVAVLGVAEIALGTLAVAVSGGILSTIGWTLISEGINDICTGAKAVYDRDQNFAKSWMISKVTRIAIAVVSFGFSHVKSIFDGSQSIVETAGLLKEKFVSGAKELLCELKQLPQKIAMVSKSALKSAFYEVGKHVGKEFLKRGGNIVANTGQAKLNEYLEKRVKNNLEKKLNENFHFKATLEKYILVQLEANHKVEKTYIVGNYFKCTSELLTPNKLGKFRQILFGCAKGTIMAGKAGFKKSVDSEMYELCAPFLSLLDTVQGKTFDVDDVVNLYTKEVIEDFKKLYEELKTPDMNTDNQGEIVVAVKEDIIKQSAEKLYDLVQKAFESTMTNCLAKKMGEVVDIVVFERRNANDLCKEAITRITSISFKEISLTTLSTAIKFTAKEMGCKNILQVSEIANAATSIISISKCDISVESVGKMMSVVRSAAEEMGCTKITKYLNIADFALQFSSKTMTEDSSKVLGNLIDMFQMTAKEVSCTEILPILNITKAVTRLQSDSCIDSITNTFDLIVKSTNAGKWTKNNEIKTVFSVAEMFLKNKGNITSDKVCGEYLRDTFKTMKTLAKLNSNSNITKVLNAADEAMNVMSDIKGGVTLEKFKSCVEMVKSVAPKGCSKVLDFLDITKAAIVFSEESTTEHFQSFISVVASRARSSQSEKLSKILDIVETASKFTPGLVQGNLPTTFNKFVETVSSAVEQSGNGEMKELLNFTKRFSGLTSDFQAGTCKETIGNLLDTVKSTACERGTEEFQNVLHVAKNAINMADIEKF